MRIPLLLALPFLAAQLSATEFADGQKLYTGKCGRCHELYNPAHYDDEQWNRWLYKMGQKARLSDSQFRQLSDYLQSLRTPATVSK